MLCMMRTHIFVCIIHGIIIPPLLHPWYVIITPMYNVHSYFSLKKFGPKKVHILHGKIRYAKESMERNETAVLQESQVIEGVTQ